tara:strand:+ start:127 stop:378 length:252 start_codon:yes stop_codon:yes gene_type:complete
VGGKFADKLSGFFEPFFIISFTAHTGSFALQIFISFPTLQESICDLILCSVLVQISSDILTSIIHLYKIFLPIFMKYQHSLMR